jgi:hypothetical protein
MEVRENVQGLKEEGKEVYEELKAVVEEFVRMQLHPSPYGLRQVGMALLELREIMLQDCLDMRFTKEAIQRVRWWIENTRRGNSYELWKDLRELKEFIQKLKEMGHGCEG